MYAEIRYPKTDAEIAANPWVEVTADQYQESLEVLPPAAWKKGAFMVGEALCHMDDGRVVYSTYARVDGKCYFKPYPLAGFDPAVFAKEIKLQGYVGQFARSIESGWLGRVIAVEGKGSDVMLKMQGVNDLVRAIKGGDIEDAIDDDDTQWFAPEDLKFVNVV
jgi:hypothetical protein